MKKNILFLFVTLTSLVSVFILSGFYKPAYKENIKEDKMQKKGLVIASNGRSLAPIILPKDHTPLMKEAANDLATYIKKISGATPEIKIGAPNPIPEKAIWVGHQTDVGRLFPEIKFSYDHPEEVINAANHNHIIISGRDRWNPNAMTMPDRTGKNLISGIQQEYGTNNAVYTFIQNQLGVRWLWPGDTGEDIIKRDELIIEPFVYRHHPTIRDRGGMLHLLRLISNKGGDEEHKWARWQRMQLGSLDISLHHPFHDWWARFGNTNPEYFAMLPNGKREPKFGPTNVKICQSNPMVWEQWMKDVEKQIKENPNQNNFSAAPNDGWSQGHCTCEKCRAWDGPGFSWSKPNLSDREMRFVNTLADLLEKKYPGKGYFVSTTAYGYTRPAPLKEKPLDNVLIVGVFNFFQRGDGFEDDRSLAIQQYNDWGKVAKLMSWRPNVGNPAGQINGMPDVAPRQLASDFRQAQKNGCLGLFFDSYWNHWANQGILYYTMAQCAWNPQVNIDSLLNDYHQRAYGPASAEMKQYWELMENTRNELVEKVKTRQRFQRTPEVYTAEWFAKAASLLDKAESKVKNADKKYLERILYAKAGFELTELIIETRKLNQEWEKNKTDKKLMDAIDGQWAKAKDMKSRFPKYAVNFNKTFNNPNASGIIGMHYKKPLSDKQLRRTENIPGYE
jgi:hypothetical protein